MLNKYHKMFVEKGDLILYPIKDQTVFRTAGMKLAGEIQRRPGENAYESKPTE